MINRNAHKVRHAVAALSISGAALVGLLVHEGYRGEAYIPVPGDVPTIGFGTTGGVRMGDRIDPIQALQRAQADMVKFEGAVKECVKVPLAQHEYDAYLSFSYNVGSGAFCRSTLVRVLNTGDYDGACAQLLRWTFFQGKDCKLPENRRLCGGLATRRISEYNQCMGV